MIAITSIAPGNVDRQKACINTWLENGLDVVSLNHHSEITGLDVHYPEVDFIPTYRTMEHKWGKPYVQISAALDLAKEENIEQLVLINSDVELTKCRGLLKMYFDKPGITIAHRMDYTHDDKSDGKLYVYGIDLFLIPKEFYSIFPQSMYCFGQTWWDFWIPYRAMVADVPVFRINEPVLWHRWHEQKWSAESWRRMTDYFAWDSELFWHERTELTTGRVLKMINKHINLCRTK